jgi:hypothetical protein
LTTVYSNTHKPYAEWIPSHKIITTYEGILPRFNWLSEHTYHTASPIANTLAANFHRQQRFGFARIDVARYKVDVLEAICVILRSKGFSAEPELNRVEINHCHTIVMRKR